MTRSNIVKCKTEKEKKDIAAGWAWQNTMNKTAYAKAHGISLRTLNRILDEMNTIPQVYDYTITKNQITIFCDDESRSVLKGYPKFNQIKSSLFDNDFDDKVLAECYELLSLPKFVEKFSEGNITVDHEGGKVFYGTFEIKNSLVDHLFKKLDEGEDVKSFVKFMDKLLMNPKKNVVDELYPFMQHNSITIDNEGFIIAYRSVRKDWKDFHSGTMDNSIGSVVSMPRTMVDDDPNKTCSTGIHCASYDYARMFGGSECRMIKVKVCPSDVVSVPVDYSGEKMRVCKLEVLEEVFGEPK